MDELGVKVKLLASLWLTTLMVTIVIHIYHLANQSATNQMNTLFIVGYALYLLIPVTFITIVVIKESSTKSRKDSRLVSKLFRKHTEGNYQNGITEHVTKTGRKYTVEIRNNYIEIKLEDTWIDAYGCTISQLRK